jgi:hypothetical protein
MIRIIICVSCLLLLGTAGCGRRGSGGGGGGGGAGPGTTGERLATPSNHDVCATIVPAACDWMIQCDRWSGTRSDCVVDGRAECCIGGECSWPATGTRAEVESCAAMIRAAGTTTCGSELRDFVSSECARFYQGGDPGRSTAGGGGSHLPDAAR